MVMLRSPYDEPRDVPWLNRTGERAVEPDELVEVPENLAKNFIEAGWINETGWVDPDAETPPPAPTPRGGKKAAHSGQEQPPAGGKESEG